MMTKISYSGYRFPAVIIQQAIWLYARFTLSFRDVEDLLAERGITVSYETVRRWVNHFGSAIATDLRKRRPKPHSTWHLDEVYIKIDGRLVYLKGFYRVTPELMNPLCVPNIRFSMDAENRRGTGTASPVAIPRTLARHCI